MRLHCDCGTCGPADPSAAPFGGWGVVGQRPRAPLRVALGSILPPLRGAGGVGAIGEHTTRCGLNLGRCANASPQLKRVKPATDNTGPAQAAPLE